MRILIYLLAALGAVFLIVLVAGYFYLLQLESDLISGDYLGDEYDFDYQSLGSFNEFLYFGDNYPEDYQSYPKPPSGKARLQGKIHFQGAGVEGLSINAVLNDRFYLQDIKTDADGAFSIAVEPGFWEVNLLAISNWDNKPEGDFLVRTGFEEPIDNFASQGRFSNKPVSARVENEQPTLLFDFEIVPALKIDKPLKGVEIDKPAKVELEWQAVSEANQYLVVISEVEQDDEYSSVSYQIADRISDQAQLDLDAFALVATPNEKHTYSFYVAAYGEQGFLTDSGLSTGKFELDGYQIAEDEVVSELGASFDQSSFTEYQENTRRLKAVEVLIKDELFDEAKSLIALISEVAPKGKRAALNGYLLASQGLCKEAESHFKQAKTEAGYDCFTTRYYAACDYP